MSQFHASHVTHVKTALATTHQQSARPKTCVLCASNLEIFVKMVLTTLSGAQTRAKISVPPHEPTRQPVGKCLLCTLHCLLPGRDKNLHENLLLRIRRNGFPLRDRSRESLCTWPLFQKLQGCSRPCAYSKQMWSKSVVPPSPPSNHSSYAEGSLAGN